MMLMFFPKNHTLDINPVCLYNSNDQPVVEYCSKETCFSFQQNCVPLVSEIQEKATTALRKVLGRAAGLIESKNSTGQKPGFTDLSLVGVMNQ